MLGVLLLLLLLLLLLRGEGSKRVALHTEDRQKGDK
jgi:hypothetical protein